MNYLAVLKQITTLGMNLHCRTADVRTVRIQKHARKQQLEFPSQRLALPILQNAGKEEKDHQITGFSLSGGGAQQAAIPLSIRPGNSLIQPKQTGPFHACLCWKWLSFRRALSIKRYGNLCQGGNGCDRYKLCQESASSSFGAREKLGNPWQGAESETIHCFRQELWLRSQTVSVQTSALKLTCYDTWDKWLNLSVPQLPHLYNGHDNNCTYIVRTG